MSPRDIFVAMLTLAFCLHFDNSARAQGERERDGTRYMYMGYYSNNNYNNNIKEERTKQRPETIEGAARQSEFRGIFTLDAIHGKG